MLRMIDIALATTGLIATSPLMALLYVIGLFDTGSPLFKQVRLGQNQRPFTLVKFRTMKVDTQSVATHLANPNSITYWGGFLRKSKLDELPQLWNVAKGDMSLVGPRPCLPSQTELIQERLARNVFKARPGITGLAQIQGIDMSTPRFLAETDAKMLANLGVASYFIFILRTLIGAGRGDRIRPKSKT